MKQVTITILQKTLEYFSRKFVLALACLGGGFYLVLNGKPLGEFVALAGVVLAFYNGANVAQDFVHAYKGSKPKDDNLNHKE